MLVRRKVHTMGCSPKDRWDKLKNLNEIYERPLIWPWHVELRWKEILNAKWQSYQWRSAPRHAFWWDKNLIQHARDNDLLLVRAILATNDIQACLDKWKRSRLPRASMWQPILQSTMRSRSGKSHPWVVPPGWSSWWARHGRCNPETPMHMKAYEYQN